MQRRNAIQNYACIMNVVINQKNGIVAIDHVKVGKDFTFNDLQKEFSGMYNLIFGEKYNAKYCIGQLVELFENKFRVCLRFENETLVSVSFLLISEHHGAAPEYPTIDEVQPQFNYLNSLLKSNLSGREIHHRMLCNAWIYDWGEVILIFQIQDSSIFLDLTWNR